MEAGGGDVSREKSRPLPEWAEPARSALEAYAQVLSTTGVERGLIGPREVPRIWDRHLLNCLVVADPQVDLVPQGCMVADVGSGAGLPGLAWGLGRPDIRVVLIEPLLRRSTFLTEAVAELGVADRVTVLRERAEDLIRQPGWVGADVVTARAVAPLDRLLGWTIPLVRPGGRLVALKGATASEEIDAAGPVLETMQVAHVRLVSCGEGIVDPTTLVVVGERR